MSWRDSNFAYNGFRVDVLPAQDIYIFYVPAFAICEGSVIRGWYFSFEEPYSGACERINDLHGPFTKTQARKAAEKALIVGITKRRCGSRKCLACEGKKRPAEGGK